MVSERNRILKLKDYLESLGIYVNIAKNKARGNKGIFLTKKDTFRIDISKNLPEDKILSTMLHEFSHFFHFQQDSSLESFDFIFKNYDENIKEELIKVSIHEIPREMAAELFKQKEHTSNEIKYYYNLLKQKYNDFKLTEPFSKIKNKIKRPLSYLLKYDKVKIGNIVYSENTLEKDFNDIDEDIIIYIHLKSKQRLLKRINARINKLNRYYLRPTELFARFVEQYVTNPESTKKLAPKASSMFELALKNHHFPMLNKVNDIVKSL